MDDLREKTIKGLATCGGDDPDCKNCPYYGEHGNGFGCETIMQRDALALLKTQEPVEPERAHSGGGSTWWNVCGSCKTAINPNDKFCHECGRAVKWDD